MKLWSKKKKKTIKDLNKNTKKLFAINYEVELKKSLKEIFCQCSTRFNFDNKFSNVEVLCLIFGWPKLKSKDKPLQTGSALDYSELQEIAVNQQLTNWLKSFVNALDNCNRIFLWWRLYFLTQLQSQRIGLWMSLQKKGHRLM